MDPTDWLAFLTELADRADEIALRLFRSRDLRIDEKADSSLVSEADLAIEEDARRLLAQRYPNLGILGEEQGEDAGDFATRLIVDPIDATANFVRGIPVFATLLAIEQEGEIVAGVVSAPALATRWTAGSGCGAFRDKRRIRVSEIGELGRAQLFHGSLGGLEGSENPLGLMELIGSTARQRGFGDFYQHMLVAEGAGEIGFDPSVHPWDIAALLVIAEEAGGRATALTGERSIYAGSLVTTNGLLHAEVLQLLRRETPR